MATVLIVDDDKDVRNMIKRILERAGHETLEAKDGHQAIDRYSEAMPDVTITDIIMPDKDGIETILELKQRFSARNIIAISGGGRRFFEGYLKMARLLGADHVISKPFDPKCLVAAVESMVTTRPTARRPLPIQTKNETLPE